MREVFTKESKKSGKPRLLASIATAAGAYLLTQGYDVPMLCKWVYILKPPLFKSSILICFCF